MKKLSLAAIGALALSLVTVLVLRILPASPTQANTAAAPVIAAQAPSVQLGAAAPAASTAGLPTVRYQGQPTNSTLEIQGTSTFHDWEMKSTTMGGWVDFPVGVSFDLRQTNLPGLKDGNLPASGTFAILVRQIHSQVSVMASVMDGVMQDAMKETNFHRIEYHVTELKLQTPHVAGQPFTFDAKGDLAIAGVTNKVAFPVTIEPLGTNAIVIRGAAKLKMTDYKVPPPAPNIAGLGVMKCGDDIKIIFNWTLLQTPPKP